MQFKNLTLEISLKPFRERTEAESRAVCGKNCSNIGGH